VSARDVMWATSRLRLPRVGLQDWPLTRSAHKCPEPTVSFDLTPSGVRMDIPESSFPSKGKPSVMPEKASAMTETLRAMEGSIACRVVGVRTQK
jgi:hypothetical protein